MKKDSKEKLLNVIKEIDSSYITTLNKTNNAQQLQRFLSDLGYSDMYYQYKNNPPQMEKVFSKLLKGRNLAAFLKLLHSKE